MKKPINALILEDSEDDALLVVRELGRQGLDPKWERAWTAATMKSSLEDNSWDVVLSDYSMPGFDAPAALQQLQETGQDIPFIVISGTIGEEAAVAAMRSGAHDYLMKGKLARLGAAIEREIRDAGIRREHRLAIEQIQHLNRVLRAVRNVNELIIQEKDPARLITRVCQLLIESRGYVSAMLIQTDDAGQPRFVAHSADGDTNTQQSAEAIRSNGLTACMKLAFESSGPVVVGDDSPDCGDCPLHSVHSGRQRMVKSLVHGDRCFGVLGIALPHDMRLDAEELALFDELTGDLGFALHGIEQGERLGKVHKRHHSLLSNIPGMSYSARLDWSAELMINSEQVSGYLNDQVNSLEHGWISIVHEDDRKRLLETSKSLREEPQSLAREYRIIDRTGHVRFVEDFATSVFDPDGTFVRIDGIVFDITARKAAEREKADLAEQLRQSQRMEAVGQLAGGIAHDFNNLLTAIMGYCELLGMDIEADSDLHEGLEQITKAGDRATGLVRQLLAFSRRQVLQPKVLDLNEVVTDLEKMLRRVIGEDIDLATVPASDLGTVRADPGQIEQVLMNLAVNARDAMPQGGKLTIETVNVMLDQEYAASHVDVQPGPHVMLAVSDTGHGMDEHTREKVFEPFFTTKPKGKGTGLGLSTVYGIVKQSGGNIWIYSEPGQGTSFKIYLPRVDEPASDLREAGDSVSAEALHGAETVLVVEDDAMVRALASKVLERFGYEVLTAEDGEEALYLSDAHEGPIELVLTDVVMPGANGRQVWETLHERRPNSQVCYMSGYTDNSIVHHGVLDGETQFLQKPFTPESLARKVREVLDA